MSEYRNNVANEVSGTPGTGTITLGAAVTGAQGFSAAYGANATVDVFITDGAAWEVARNCTYTHSGTTLTRGTLEASSTGSALSLTSAAVVRVAWPASEANVAGDVCSNGGYVFARNNGTQAQALTSGAWNRVRGSADSPSSGALSAEVVDERGWWNAGIARFQPLLAGKYLVTFVITAQFSGSSAGTVQYVAAIYKNGEILLRGTRAEVPVAASYTLFEAALFCGVVEMNGTTDYMEPYVFAACPGATTLQTLNTADSQSFSARFLGL